MPKKNGNGSKGTYKPGKKVLVPRDLIDKGRESVSKYSSAAAKEDFAKRLALDILKSGPKKSTKPSNPVHELPQHEPVTSHEPEVNHSTHYFDVEPPEDFHKEPEKKVSTLPAIRPKSARELNPNRKREYFEPPVPVQKKEVALPSFDYHDEPEEDHDEHKEFMQTHGLPPTLHPDRFRNPEHKHAILNFRRDPYQSVENGPEELHKFLANKAATHVEDDSNDFESRRNAHRLLQHIARHGNENVMLFLHDHPSPEVKNIIASRTENPSILKKYIDSHPSIYERPEHVKTADARYNKFSWMKKRIGNKHTRRANKQLEKSLYKEDIELIKSLTSKKLLG